MWENYCYCENVSVKCSVCQFRMVYLNDEYDLYENCFNLHFLAVFHEHIYKNLRKLLEVNNNHVVCKFLNRKYYYFHKDWFTGEIERFYWPYCLEIYENNELNKIKNKEFKVVIDPLPLKKYLFRA